MRTILTDALTWGHRQARREQAGAGSLSGFGAAADRHSGEFLAAVEAYKDLLATTPGDDEAKHRFAVDMMTETRGAEIAHAVRLAVLREHLDEAENRYHAAQRRVSGAVMRLGEVLEEERARLAAKIKEHAT